MMKHPFYLAAGVLVVLMVVAVEAYGWGMTSRSEVRNVPRTVRDNPGSYRPTYIHTGRSLRRGK
jgi:hypothetical protein